MTEGEQKRLPNDETTELLLTLARERLIAQEKAWEAHRTKAGFILAAVAVAVTRLHELITGGPSPALPLLIAAIAGAGGGAIVAIWPRDIFEGPDISKSLRGSAWKKKDVIVIELATQHARTIDLNAVAIRETGRAVKFALGCLAAALALFISIAITLS